MEAEKDQPDTQTSQPRVPDSRLPGVDPPESPPASDKEDSQPSRSALDKCEDSGYELSALALWPVFTMITILIVFTIATAWYGPRHVLQIILRYLMPERPSAWHALAIWGAIVTCITCAVPVLLLLLPVPTLMFGFWKGFIITFMGLMCAASLSFFIGRCVAQRPIRRYLEGKRFTRIMRILHVMEDTEQTSMRLLILYRFLPIPMGVRNYGPSVLRVPIRQLVLAAIPHSLWSATVFATAGSALKGPAQLLRDGDKIPWRTPHWQQILGLVIASLSFLIFTWVAWRAYADKVEEEERRKAANATASSALKGADEGGSYGTTA